MLRTTLIWGTGKSDLRIIALHVYIFPIAIQYFSFAFIFRPSLVFLIENLPFNQNLAYEEGVSDRGEHFPSKIGNTLQKNTRVYGARNSY